MEDQTTMLIYETEDEWRYQTAMSTTLEKHVEISINTVRLYLPEALKKDPRGYRVGQSFGKDSGCVEEICKMAEVPFISVHNHTSLDAPEALRFGKRNYPNTLIEYANGRKALLHVLAYEKTTLPTRGARWCCDIYKERKSGMVNIFGIRAFESRRRNWKIWTPHIKTGEWTLNPILYWPDHIVWEFIKKHNVKYCELYDQGFSRLGCIGCPLNPSSQSKEFARYPGYEKAWKWAITKFWDRMHDAKNKDGEYYWHKFKTASDLWYWWLQENDPLKSDDCQMDLS